MSKTFLAVRSELLPTLRLAIPLASAELAWMAMSVVDTMMVGRLGAAPIAAGSLGGIVFYSVALCGTGVLLGMDTLVSQSWGAGDAVDCRRSLINGIWLGLLLSPVAIAGTLAALPVLRRFGTNPQIYEHLAPYLSTLTWSIPPLFVYAACRRYLQAVHVVRPVTFAIVSANGVNFVANWILIYGNWGAPAMGIRGAAWATCISRLYMMVVVAGAAARHGGFSVGVKRPDWTRMRRLFSLGGPAALQLGAEAAVFALVTAFASKLDQAASAAHGIALNVISATYMAPLGISSAAAVRVGNAIGRADLRGAAAAGWTALLLSAAVMSAAGVLLFAFPAEIIRLYTGDPLVVQAGVLMLAIAAFFELGDGTQVVATGALRGAADTRTPFIANVVFYWGVGLPVGYLFCFRLGWGAPGLWIGLCVALLLIGATLLMAWRRRIARLQKDQSTLP